MGSSQSSEPPKKEESPRPIVDLEKERASTPDTTYIYRHALFAVMSLNRNLAERRSVSGGTVARNSQALFLVEYLRSRGYKPRIEDCSLYPNSVIVYISVLDRTFK